MFLLLVVACRVLVAKVTDWGLSKPIRGPEGNAPDVALAASARLGLIGLLPYAAPEVISASNFSPASDVYSRGVTA
jgi:serine/threonine protein kinase